MKLFILIITRDIRSYVSSGTKILLPTIYLTLILIFFSISIQNVLLNQYMIILPQVIWLSCLLVSILTMESLYRDDYEDGTLESFVINSEILEINILAKIIGYWIVNTFPLLIIGSTMNLILTGDQSTTLVLFFSLMLGTLGISLIGSIAASLTVGVKSNNLLLSTIVLPLDIPILIFGTSCVYNAYLGISYTSEMLFLFLLVVLFLLVSPFASSMGIRNSLD